MKFFTTLLLFCLSQGLFAQSIEATWTSESKDHEPIMLVLLPTSEMLVKFGEDDGDFGPFYGYGNYVFDGDTLSMQMSTGEQYQYEIRKLDKEGFQMHELKTGESWVYHFQTKAEVPAWALRHLQTELDVQK